MRPTLWAAGHFRSIIARAVLLPLPDGPTKATIRPGASETDMSGTTGCSPAGAIPKQWVTSAVRRVAGTGAGVREQPIRISLTVALAGTAFPLRPALSPAKRAIPPRPDQYQTPTEHYNMSNVLSILWPY